MSTPRSPRLSARTRPGIVRLKKTYDVEESLPPTILLNSAHTAGLLSIPSDKALHFLRVYHDISRRSMTGWEQKVCKDLEVTPLHMAILASILNRCTTLAQKSLGKRMMISACELGERSATYELVASALRTGHLKEYDGSLRRLAILASKENDPRAMLLLGKALYGQRGNRESLAWFQKATRSPTGSLNFDGAAEALVQEGRIFLSRNETSAARDAFSKAAFELDDPTAYFYLSQLEDPGSEEQEVYLMKASTAGITEAWHNLGSLELAKDTKRSIKKMEDYGVAREWFLVAASEGFGLSMLNLAVMHKAVGEIEEGLEWLERAEETEGVEEEARRLKGEWVNGVIGVEEAQEAENETYIPR